MAIGPLRLAATQGASVAELSSGIGRPARCLILPPTRSLAARRQLDKCRHAAVPSGRSLEGKPRRAVIEEAESAQATFHPADGAQQPDLAQQRGRAERRAPVEVDVVDGETGQRQE